MLAEVSCADRVFSPTAALKNEGAMKLAKIYFRRGHPERRHNNTQNRSTEDPCHNGCHGQRSTKPYSPLPPGFKHVQINDLEALKAAIGGNTCAVMMELVQGERRAPAGCRLCVCRPQTVRRKGPAAHNRRDTDRHGRTGKLLHMSITVSSLTSSRWQRRWQGVPSERLCQRVCRAGVRTGRPRLTFGEILRARHRCPENHARRESYGKCRNNGQLFYK